MYPSTQFLIANEWVPSASGRTLDVLNPATGDKIGTVAHADRKDLDRALEAAQAGFLAWRKLSTYDRYKVLRKAADNIRTRVNDIAAIMTTEQGKPLAEAKGETALAADLIDWFAEEGRRTYGQIIPARAPGVLFLQSRDVPRVRASRAED